VDSEGDIAGYITFDAVEDACRIGELGYQSPDIFSTLLSCMVERAQRLGLNEIEIYLPSDHPFTNFCKMAGCRVVTTYPRNRDGMARVINVTALLDEIADVLSDRLKASPLANTDTRLHIKTEIGDATLLIADRQVRVENNSTLPSYEISLPQNRLVQLVMGYRSVREVMLDDGVAVSEAAVGLLDTLFPVGVPWMAHPDWF
jgi:predicted acetyltransferase